MEKLTKETEFREDALLTRKEYMRAYRKTSRAKEMWDIFVHNRLAMIGLVILCIIVLAAIFADVIADYDTVVIKAKPKERFTAPCREHPFGTDEQGE